MTSKRLQKRLDDLMANDTRPANLKSVGQKPGKGKRLTIKGAKVLGPGVAPTIINQVDPTDGGNLVLEPYPLFANMTVDDINQGNRSDCWFLAALASIVMFPTGQAFLRTIIQIDPADSTKAIVTYTRNGVVTEIYCDLLVSIEFNQFDSANQDLWVELMEKTYAYFREGLDTYASLDYGFADGIYGDLGLAANNLILGTQNFFASVRANIAAQIPQCIPTQSTGTTIPGLVQNHEYTIISIDANNVITMRNPWGTAAGGGVYMQIQPADVNGTNFTWSVEFAPLPAVVVPPPVTYTQTQYDAAVAAATAAGIKQERGVIKNLLVKVNQDLA